jgi:hypothetical protein
MENLHLAGRELPLSSKNVPYSITYAGGAAEHYSARLFRSESMIKTLEARCEGHQDGGP